jgi:hypothetical protein
MVDTNIRRSITVPVVIDKRITQYQEENGISTWNAALMELARVGLEAKSSK